jgi:purine-nucleoside phosphorylase
MILFVAAVREELGDLPGEPLGIGPVLSAARMARVLAEQRPSGVVMVGTAGAYPGGPAIRKVCKARRVGLADGAAAMGLGYTPRPPVPIPCDRRLFSKVDAVEGDVLTVGAVSTDMVLAGRLSDGWQVEHLEAFGAAAACFDAGVPFLAVLGIANKVGPEAHAQWLVHRNAAQDAARAAVLHLMGTSEP